MPWSLIGLDAVKKSISGMLTQNRLPHALMFLGPLGGGRFSLAINLAQAVNCLSPDPDGSPCGECISCKKTARRTHPDLKVIDPQGKAGIIPIDVIRDLRVAMAYRPYEGQVKVAIIREVDKLTEDSGGALLKTLEEPTPNSLFILTASSENSVMSTVVSRCQKLRIPILPRDEIMRFLSENRDLTGPKAALLAGLSDGALGEALGLDSDEAWETWTSLDAILDKDQVESRIEAAWDWTYAFGLEVDRLKKLKDASDYEQKNDFLDRIVKSLRLWWRDTSVLAVTGDSALLYGPPPSLAQKKWAARLGPERFYKHELALNHLKDSLGRSLKVELVFENYWLNVLQ